MNEMTTQPTGKDGTCVWCGEYVTDGAHISGAPVGVTDWMIDGDFGCEDSPLTGDDGTGSHRVLADIRQMAIEHNAVLEAVRWGEPR